MIIKADWRHNHPRKNEPDPSVHIPTTMGPFPFQRHNQSSLGPPTTDPSFLSAPSLPPHRQSDPQIPSATMKQSNEMKLKNETETKIIINIMLNINFYKRNKINILFRMISNKSYMLFRIIPNKGYYLEYFPN